MQTKEGRVRTPINFPGTPEETGPLRVRTDPRPPESVNAIRYQLRDQNGSPRSGGLDNWSANIPFGLDAIAAFEKAMKRWAFEGIKISGCALVVGGMREPNSRANGIHGGEVVAEWSIAGGLKARADWRDRVGGLPRPKVVPRGTTA